MIIRVGILSDTHLSRITPAFRQKITACFQDCTVIIHAGDLTSLSILDLFAGKQVYAVHGNMCDADAYQTLPVRQHFAIGDFTFGLSHGADLGQDIEADLAVIYPEAHCLIYGHTHRPICHWFNHVLYLNPGSFQSTGRLGAPGTYGIIEVGTQLKGAIHEVNNHS